MLCLMSLLLVWVEEGLKVICGVTLGGLAASYYLSFFFPFSDVGG
jgi:hypothetical protein